MTVIPPPAEMCVHVFVCVCAESVEEGRERMVNDSRIETKARGKKSDQRE